MPLHPQIAAILDATAQLPKPYRVGAAAARRGFREQCRLLPPAPQPMAEVRELELAGAGFAAPLAARFYRPTPDDRAPAILFFHGGGFVLGDLDTHDASCRRLAAASGCAVLAVDYRLAPEHPFPAAPDDCIAALRWLRTHAQGIGADAARVALAGDSAGGALAAATALRNRDEGGAPLRAQALIYPTLDHYGGGSPSYEAFGSGYGLTLASMVWFWDRYLPDASAGVPAYAAPLRAPSHRGLPPTLVITAEYDVLRDEGERYARALEAAGVECRASRYDGMNHGFAGLAGLLPEADRAIAEAAEWLQRRLRPPG